VLDWIQDDERGPFLLSTLAKHCTMVMGIKATSHALQKELKALNYAPKLHRQAGGKPGRYWYNWDAEV